MKELTFLQIDNCKNDLIKLKNDLIERFKNNDRRKKADRDYYEYEENKFHGLKDVKTYLIKMMMMMMMMMIIMKELNIYLIKVMLIN